MLRATHRNNLNSEPVRYRVAKAEGLQSSGEQRSTQSLRSREAGLKVAPTDLNDEVRNSEAQCSWVRHENRPDPHPWSHLTLMVRLENQYGMRPNVIVNTYQ